MTTNDLLERIALLEEVLRTCVRHLRGEGWDAMADQVEMFLGKESNE